MTWGILIGLVVGFIVGFFAPRRISGVLQIDHSNAQKDTYRFVIDDIDGLSSRKRIVLKVDNDAQLTAPIMERNGSN